MLRPISPIIEYTLNQDYIATFLCINKDKPELQCNGKCHLAKELQKLEKEEEKCFRINLKEYPISTINSKKAISKNTISNKHHHILNFRYSNTYAYLFSHCIFHPPTT